MDVSDIPALARRAHAAFDEIAEHLTPDERAALRSMRREAPPMCAWAMLARAPADLTGPGPRDEAWLRTFQAMGRVAPTGGSIGRTLAGEGYPEPRMRQLFFDERLVCGLTVRAALERLEHRYLGCRRLVTLVG